jgi:hypothetical protein
MRHSPERQPASPEPVLTRKPSKQSIWRRNHASVQLFCDRSARLTFFSPPACGLQPKAVSRCKMGQPVFRYARRAWLPCKHNLGESLRGVACLAVYTRYTGLVGRSRGAGGRVVTGRCRGGTGWRRDACLVTWRGLGRSRGVARVWALYGRASRTIRAGQKNLGLCIFGIEKLGKRP